MKAIIEKPGCLLSSFAVMGLSFLDSGAPDLAAQANPSQLGEIEIVDRIAFYRAERAFQLKKWAAAFPG